MKYNHMSYGKSYKSDMGKSTMGAKGKSYSSTYRGGPAAPKGAGHRGSMKAHK